MTTTTRIAGVTRRLRYHSSVATIPSRLSHQQRLTSNRSYNDSDSKETMAEQNKSDDTTGSVVSETSALEDNPCWGSPSSCSLRDLLKVMPHHERKVNSIDGSILYDSNDYLVLNKPPDLRMDGPYQATVHKLLTYWYPPPSLLRKCIEKMRSNTSNAASVEDTSSDTIEMKNDAARSEDDGGTTRSDRDDGFDDDQVDDETLLDSISQLHQHNHLEDNFLRPCHQLDFATSGILLVAKSQAAAGYIMKMFQNRESTVKKTYAAIVVGNIDHSVIDRISSMWGGPDASEDDVRRHLEKLEDSYRRSRFQHSKQKRQQPQRPSHTNQSPTPAKATFRGYQPPHSMYGKWKAEYTAKLKSSASVLSSSSDNKYRQKRKRQHSILSDDDWKFIWEPLRKLLDSSEPIQSTGGNEAWWKLDWKELSRSSRFAPLKEAVVASANRHNDLLREAQIKQRLEESSTPETNIQPMTFPTVFRLKNNDSTKSTVERDGNNDDVFYIYCPLAEDPGSFRMKIPDSDKEVDFSSTSGSFDFKPALTKCRVLERGEYHLPRMSTDDIKGGNVSHEVIAVTKVHLTLFTGRRHQLRVHMATAGFPILGDATYGMKEDMRISNTEYDQRSDNISNSTADLYKGARSEYLNVRLRTMTPAVSTRMCLHALSLRLPLPEDEDWEVFAPDPFHFDRTGVLPLPFRKQSH